MGRNQLDDIDKLFKDSLQSFQDKPEREVWEKIEQQLDEEKKGAYFFGWGMAGLAAAAVGLVFILGIRIYWSRPLVPGHLHQVSEKGARAAGSGGEAGAGGASEPGATEPGAAGAGEVTEPGAGGVTRGGGVSEWRVIGQEGSRTIRQGKRSIEQVDARAVERAAQGEQSAGGEEDVPKRTQETVKRTQETVRLAPLQATPSAARVARVELYSMMRHPINNLKKASAVHLAGRPNRWSVSGSFVQELAGYNLADHDSTAANGREVDKKQTAIFSASAGILAGYRLTKRWMLQSGLIYAWSKSISNPTTAYAVTDNNGAIKYQFNTPTGYGFLPFSVATGDSVRTNKSSTRLHYLSVPFIASYIFKTKEFTFLAGAGVIGNILTSAKVATTLEGTSGQQPESIVTLYGLRKINYGLIFKAEMQYAFRANWSLDLVATSKNALTSINSNGRYLTYPYYIGLGLGISHTF